MTEEKQQKVQELIRDVCVHPCDFYRAHWGAVERFEDLPFMDVEKIIATPFSARSYTTEKGLAKIVRTHRVPFLVQWSLRDLKAERFGDTTCKRPLVLLSDSHDALEKSLWFYEHDILPLIGETNNLQAASFAADAYAIDALVADSKTVLPFLAEYEKGHDVKTISVTLIENRFDPAMVARLQISCARVLSVLACSETGAFGVACPEQGDGEVCFHPNDESIVEIENGELVVTRLALLRTPIIRYRTGIRAEAVSADCSCREVAFTLT